MCTCVACENGRVQIEVADGEAKYGAPFLAKTIL